MVHGEWLDLSGRFLQQIWLKYAGESRNTVGNVESWVFYSDGNQEVLVEQPGNDVVTLVEKGMTKAFFNSRAEFARHYLAEIRLSVRREKLDELWKQCDFYLEINYWREIHDAVNAAHQNNLLILEFENILHHPEPLVKGCKFFARDYYKNMKSWIEFVWVNLS